MTSTGRPKIQYTKEHAMSTASLPPDPYSLLPQIPAFVLASDDVQDGKPIDPQFVHSWAAGTQDTSPELHWSGFPKETRSFVVTLYDPDAATGSGFWHWMLVGLPPLVTALRRGAGIDKDLPKGAFHIRNDLGGKRYLGPAPPPGDRPHRYVFAVHALDVAALDITSDTSPAFVGFNMTGHTLARAVIRPTFAI
jgi:Raf kinase inhibitor-like YbhB/YbcL family protein